MVKATKIDTRCLECSHEFPYGTMVLSEGGSWTCPKCNSPQVEKLMKAYKYDEVKVTHKEGHGHD